MPLTSAEALTRLKDGEELPPWEGVEYLTREQYAEYQAFARVSVRNL
jgi:hypothetical protein